MSHYTGQNRQQTNIGKTRFRLIRYSKFHQTLNENELRRGKAFVLKLHPAIINQKYCLSVRDITIVKLENSRNSVSCN